MSPAGATPRGGLASATPESPTGRASCVTRVSRIKSPYASRDEPKARLDLSGFQSLDQHDLARLSVPGQQLEPARRDPQRLGENPQDGGVGLAALRRRADLHLYPVAVRADDPVAA